MIIIKFYFPRADPGTSVVVPYDPYFGVSFEADFNFSVSS